MKAKIGKWIYFVVGFTFWVGAVVTLIYGEFNKTTLFLAIFCAVMTSLFLSGVMTYEHEEKFHGV